jgi:hypothetical protein
MKANKVDVLAPTVLRDLEEINDSLEARGSRQLWRDVIDADWQYRINLDLAIAHTIALADAHARVHPDADAARDHPTPDPRA